MEPWHNLKNFFGFCWNFAFRGNLGRNFWKSSWNFLKIFSCRDRVGNSNLIIWIWRWNQNQCFYMLFERARWEESENIHTFNIYSRNNKVMCKTDMCYWAVLAMREAVVYRFLYFERPLSTAHTHTKYYMRHNLHIPYIQYTQHSSANTNPSYTC